MMGDMQIEMPPTPPEPREGAGRLKAALRATNVAQAELARRLGLNQTTVNRWCLGLAPISKMAWLATTQALGLAADWMPAEPDA